MLQIPSSHLRSWYFVGSLAELINQKVLTRLKESVMETLSKFLEFSIPNPDQISHSGSWVKDGFSKVLDTQSILLLERGNWTIWTCLFIFSINFIFISSSILFLIYHHSLNVFHKMSFVTSTYHSNDFPRFHYYHFHQLSFNLVLVYLKVSPHSILGKMLALSCCPVHLYHFLRCVRLECNVWVWEILLIDPSLQKLPLSDILRINSQDASSWSYYLIFVFWGDVTTILLAAACCFFGGTSIF